MLAIALGAAGLAAAQETEPNDDPNTANTLSCPASFLAESEPLGDVDYYSISGQPGMLLRAEIDASRSGSGLDAILGLFDPNLNLLATADDFFGSDPVLEEVLQEAGPYLLAVGAYQDFDFNGGADALSNGEYTLILTCEMDGNEPNDDIVSPAPFTCGTTTLGIPPTVLVGPAGDVDFYSFGAPAGTAVTVEVFASRFHGSALDPILGLFDPSGTLLVTNDNRFVFDPFLSTVVTGGGTYGVAVAAANDFGFDGGADSLSQGRYDITINCALPGEGNLGFEEGTLASFVGYGDAQASSGLGPIQPPEGGWMAFMSTGGTAVASRTSMLERTALVPAGSLCLTYQYNFLTNENTPDPIFNDRLGLEVHRPGGTEARLVADTTSGFSSAPGGWGGQTGWRPDSYQILPDDEVLTLRWVVEDVPDTLTDSAALIDDLVFVTDDANEPNDSAAAGTLRGFPFVDACSEIEPATDVDYYLFPASAGDVITAEVLAARAGSTLDARVAVLDPNGLLLGESDDAADLDPIVTVTVAAAGTHAVAVTSWGDAGYDGGLDGNDAGFYSLRVSLSSPAPPRRRLFALDEAGGGMIYELDPNGGAILNSFPTIESVAAGADGLAYDEETNELFVINGTGTRTIFRLNASTGQLLGSFPAPTVEAIDGLGHDAGVLYAQIFTRDEVLSIDPASGAELETRRVSPVVDLSGGLTAGRGRMYSTEAFLSVDELDPASITLLNSFAIPTSGAGFGLGFDGTDLFVSLSTAPGKIAALDPNTGTLLREFADPTPGVTLSALAAGPPPSGAAVPLPPGEVDDLSITGGAVATLAWTKVDEALTYDVYRGAASALSPATYGGCFAGGLSKSTFTLQDPDIPGLGEAHAYLVAAANTGGKGTMGTDSDGLERPLAAFAPACP